MQKYEVIEKALAEGDREILVEAIGNICYLNRDFSSGEFDEVLSYVEKRQKIKEGYDGKPLISQQKRIYTDDDFADAIYEMKSNFCDERIEDVKAIGRALYGKGAATVNATKEEQTIKRPQTSYPVPPSMGRSVNDDRGNAYGTGTVPNAGSHQGKLNPLLVAIIIAIIVILVMLFLILVV